MRCAGIFFHSHQNTETEKFGQQMRTAVTHKWKRVAGHRQKTDIHADVDRRMNEKKERETNAEQNFKIASAAERNAKHSPENDAVQNKQK